MRFKLALLFPFCAAWEDSRCADRHIYAYGYLWIKPNDGWGLINDANECRGCLRQAVDWGWGKAVCRKYAGLASFTAGYE